MLFDPPSRIIVIGTSFSGKATLASKLAIQLSLNQIELDQLHWRENWKEAPLQVFRRAVGAAISGSSWILDGNYGKVRDLLWPRATHLIWLDYPFLTVFGRCLSRTIRRILTREKLWANNRETFAKSFLSKDSIIVWMVKTFHRRKEQYPKNNVSRKKQSYRQEVGGCSLFL